METCEFIKEGKGQHETGTTETCYIIERALGATSTSPQLFSTRSSLQYNLPLHFITIEQFNPYIEFKT